MSGVLKSPTIIVLLLISPFILISICLTYCGAPILGVYIFIIVIYDKPTANLILHGEKLKAFPLKSGKRQGCQLTTTIQHSFGSFGHSNQSRKRKGIQIGKEEVKLSLFANDMILYMENPKDSIRKLLELINEYSKLQDIKSTHRNPLHS